MTTVGRWMTPNPVTIDASATIIEAIHLMKEKKVRRLPVMADGKLAGLVTEKMINEFTPGKATSLDTWEVHYILSSTPVTEAMTRTPYTVTPATPLPEAAQLLHDRKLNGVLVLDERGELTGIFTMTNALEALIALCREPRG